MRSSHIFYKFFLETTKAILTTVKAEGEEYPIDIHAVCTIVHHFYKKGGDDNNGDFQKDIRDTMPQINKQVFFIIIMLCGLLMVNKHAFFIAKNSAGEDNKQQTEEKTILGSSSVPSSS